MLLVASRRDEPQNTRASFQPVAPGGIHRRRPRWCLVGPTAPLEPRCARGRRLRSAHIGTIPGQRDWACCNGHRRRARAGVFHRDHQRGNEGQRTGIRESSAHLFGCALCHQALSVRSCTVMTLVMRLPPTARGRLARRCSKPRR